MFDLDRNALKLVITISLMLAVAPINPLASIVLCAGSVLFTPPRQRLSRASFWGGLLFIASLLLSTAFSSNVDTSTTTALIIAPGICLYILVALYADSDKLLALVAILCVLFALLMLAQLSFYLLESIIGDILQTMTLAQGSQLPLQLMVNLKSNVLVAPNDIVFVALVLPLAIGVRQSVSGLTYIFLLLVLLTLGGFAIVILQSRVTVICLVLGIVTFSLYGYRLKPFIWLGMLFLGIVVVDLLLGMPLMSKFGNFKFTRLDVWQVAWAIFRDNLCFGSGPQTFKQLYPIYQYKIGMSPHELIDPRNMPWPHSLYFEMLAERGVLGLASLLVLLANAFFQLVRLRSYIEKSLSPLYSGVFAAFIVFIVAAAVELTFARLWVGLAFGGLLGFIEASYQLHASRH